MKHQQHLAGLDGLRGIAALFVVWLHTDQSWSLHLPTGSAELSVDFFFMLSGYVIASAYEDRRGINLSWLGFMGRRIIRLWPMLILGQLIGFPVVALSLAHHHLLHTAQLAAVAAAAPLLLPIGIFFGLGPFPQDNPLWSLFFEVWANAIHGTSVRKITGRAGVILISFVAAALAFATFKVGGTNRMGPDGDATFVLGALRVALPYMIGIALWRARTRLQIGECPSWIGPCILIGCLALDAGRLEPLFQFLSVTILFPICMLTTIKATQPRVVSKLFLALGALSYPLYALHMPILRAAKFVFSNPRFSTMQYPAAGVTLVLCVVFSWTALKIYDEPVRAWLSRRQARAQGHVERSSPLAEQAVPS